MKKRFAVSRVFNLKGLVFNIMCFMIAAAIAGHALPAAAEIQVQRTDLGTLGGNWSLAYGINNGAQIVGYSTMPGADTVQHAFLWQDGVMTDLGTFGGTWSSAKGINNAGQILYNKNYGAGIWQNGAITEIGTLGGTWTIAEDINDLGQVVGVSGTSTGGEHFFLWQNGAMVDLWAPGFWSGRPKAVNNVGQIVGWTHVSSGEQHAFLWENGIVTDLGTLGGTWSEARGINDKGQVVGFSTNALGVTHAFLWEKGKMTDLDPLNPSVGSTANAVNNAGQIVGTRAWHAVLWQYGEMHWLQTPEPGTCNACSSASGINDNGQVVGSRFVGDPGAGDLRSQAVLWTVTGASDLLGELTPLVYSFDLAEGVFKSLAAKLDNAIKALEADKTTAACGDLTAFMNEVRAHTGKTISVDQAAQVISAAEAIRTAAGCR